MMPGLPKPRPLDIGAAVARLATDDTRPHRDRWPDLAWVWDELDELREMRDKAVPQQEFSDLLDERNKVQEELTEAIYSIRAALGELDRIDDTTNPTATRAAIERAANHLAEAVE